MKKLRHALKFVLAIAAAFAAFALAGCTSCSISYISREECIPEKTGESEGLWLYHGNIRSRTDGSEREEILTDITVDGETYSPDGYDVCYSRYAKASHKILYELQMHRDGTRRIYCYDYKEKTEKLLYTVPRRWYNVYFSDYYFFVENTNASYYADEDVSLLYDLDGNLVCDGLYDRAHLNRDYTTHGVLDGDLLYCFTENAKGQRVIRWYRDGQLLETPFYDKTAELYRCGDYMYDLDYYGCVQALNLTTGELAAVESLEFPDAYSTYFQGRYVQDGALYITVTVTKRDGSDGYEEEYLFYKVVGAKAERICGFTNMRSGGMHIFGRNGLLYVRQDYNGKYFEYNPESGKINIVKSLPSEQRRKEVGGFTFYVTEKRYGSYHGRKSCFYLCREKDGVSEVMQYTFSEDYAERNFYDDICGF